MTEKTEWELVDAPAEEPRAAGPRMKALLGPLWRWKVFGGVVVAGMVLVLFVALASMIMITVAAGALVLLAVGKIRQWLRRDGGTLSV